MNFPPIDDDAFIDLVERYAEDSQSDDELAYLLSPEIVPHTRVTLITLGDAARAEITERRAEIKRRKTYHLQRGTMRDYYDEENEFETWRAGRSAYLSGINGRLAELRFISKVRKSAPSPDQATQRAESRARGERINESLDDISRKLDALIAMLGAHGTPPSAAQN